MLCKTAKGLDEEAQVASEARNLGLQAEVFDSAATALLDPSVTMSVAGAVYFPQDCHLSPSRFMASIQRRFTLAGGIIESDVNIDGIETRNGQVVAVKGAGRRFEGEKFVVAGGSWSDEILKLLRINLPLQAGKGYSLTLQNPPELPRICSIFAEAKVAITPMAKSLRFGGTMEVGAADFSVNPARVRGIIKSVAQYFPRFSEADFREVKPWVGLRPVPPDGIPYLGPVRGFSNLFLASGHAMMGLSLGPVSGRLVADLLAGDMPFRSIDGLSPNRFR